MPTTIVNGTRMNFVQLCEGTAARDDLVMIHGLGANMAFWYFNYAAELARQFRVTLFDLRGHGRSEMPPCGYSPEQLADDLATLLDLLDIQQPHLLAHSFGGVVAMRFALKYPTRIHSLVLADTHISAARHFDETRCWTYGRTMQATLDSHGFDLDTRDPYFGYRLLTRVARMQSQGTPIPADLFSLVNPLTGNSGRGTAAQWLKLMDTTAAESELMGDDGLSLERLRGFQFPIMAMYGDRSPARVTGTELLNVWPRAVFRNVRNAGHFFPVSRSAEVIAACRLFWSGGAEQSWGRSRAGETPRCYFRSDRIFQEELGWYIATRELPRIGPFPAFQEAEFILQHAILNNLDVS